MKCSQAVFSTLCLTLLLFISTVDGFLSNTEIKPIDPHQCWGAAFVADGNRFKFQYHRNNKITPPRTVINNQHPYIFSTPFRQGQTLFISGKFNWLRGPSSFTINLLGGVPAIDPAAGADVLHIQFTFDARSGRGGNIIFNTFKRGKWLEEVKTTNPFSANRGFWLSITAMATKFEIRTDGRKLLEYHYRLPLDYITYINGIGDDTKLDKISLGGQIMKAPLRVIVPEGSFRGEGDYLLFDAIPTNFEWGIRFSDGKNLILEMTANMEQKVMTMNSRINRQWGEELRAWSFPFEAGKMFNMEVNIFPSRADIRVFGTTIALFPHRVNATAYGELTFFGSLEIRTLNFCSHKMLALWFDVNDLNYHAGYMTNKTVPYGD